MKEVFDRWTGPSRLVFGNARSWVRSTAGVQVVSHLRNPLYRNGYALTISAAITSVVGFVYWLLAAHLYTADAVGTNSAAISTMIFLAGLASLYLDGTLVRFVPRAGMGTARLVRWAYAISVTTAVLVGSIFLLGLQLWSPALGFLNTSWWLRVGFLLATMVWCIFVEQDAALTGLRQAGWVPVENAAYAVAKLVLLIVFSALLPNSGVFASWTAAAAMLIIPISWLIFRRLVPLHTQTTQHLAMPLRPRPIVRFAGANYVGQLFVLAYTLLPPVMVLQLAGSSASAYFFVPWMIAGFLRIVSVNMSASLTVEGSRDQARLVHHFRHVLINMLRLLTPIAVLVALTSPYLLSIFGSSYASEGALLLSLLALSTIPNIIVTLYLGFLRVQNRIGGVIVVHGALAVGILGLSYVWLQSFGIAGVGLAWLVCQSTVAIVLLSTQLRPVLKRGPTVVEEV